MFLLPLFHRLQGGRCVVIGGGQTALRKLRWLLKAKAQVVVVAPQLHPEVSAMVEAGQVDYTADTYQADQLDAQLRLIVSATNDRAVNKSVYERALELGVPINCVDDPQHCTVSFPAIVDRTPVVAAISSAGAAPVLARYLRAQLERLLPPDLGRVAEVLAGMRDRVKTALPDLSQRLDFFDELFSRPVASAQDSEYVAQLLDDFGARAEGGAGRVVLLGAGPGDPELMTLKGFRYLQRADVILHDQLVNPQIMDYARRDADRVYVGKIGPKPGEPVPRKNSRSFQQGAINDLILEHARQGKFVVRLKGGDPFVYGRGGEEMQILMDAGIDVEVVPGISAAFGAASYAGIPLTHREHAQSVRFVTGHRVNNEINLDWPEFAKPGQTLVIYMGLVGLQQIADSLIQNGAEDTRPVALVEHATLPQQRVVTGSLADIAGLAREAEINGPTVVIVGDVVGLYQAGA